MDTAAIHIWKDQTKRENLLTGFIFALSNADFPNKGILWENKAKKTQRLVMYTSFP